MLFRCWERFQAEMTLLVVASFSETEAEGNPFQVSTIIFLASSFLQSMRSYLNRPRLLLPPLSKKEINGLWSELSYPRYWHLAEGKASTQWVLATALSSRHLTIWSSRLPLQKSGSPECWRSNKSPSEKKGRRSEKELSSCTVPPSFSSLHKISFRSPVMNQASSRVWVLFLEVNFWYVF